jgi:hypothetical protein
MKVMKKLLLVLVLMLGFNTIAQTDSKYCKKIKMSVDQFDGDTTYNTPYGDVDFTKIIRSTGDVTYMSISTVGSTLNYGESGFVVLLEDGNKIERLDKEIKVKTNSSYGYKYSVFFTLTDDEIGLLINSPIKA